jgi:hypothetical protein
MSITTTTAWAISQMERQTADGIVMTVHYTVDSNDGTYSAGAYGSVGLEAPEENVIAYADLTPEIVIGWVQEKLGGDEKVAEISELPFRLKLMSNVAPQRLLVCLGNYGQHSKS